MTPPTPHPSEYRIKAGADITAKFVHLAAITAGHNIIVVKDYMSHSSAKAGHHVLLGQGAGKGLLFGGHCEALHRVVLNQLGNEAYIPTHVTAGSFHELSRMYRTYEHDLDTRTQEAAQLDAIFQKAQQGDPVLIGKTPLDNSQKIRNTLEAIHDQMARTRDLMQALEPELALQKQAAIEGIYPNAVMTINWMVKRFSEKTGGTTWVQWGEGIVEEGSIEEEIVHEEQPVEPEKKEYRYAA